MIVYFRYKLIENSRLYFASKRECSDMGPGLQLALSKKIKFKASKKYQGVVNDLFYSYEKNAIYSNLSQKINVQIWWGREQYIFRSFKKFPFVFLPRPKYNVYHIENVHARSVHSLLHRGICFLNFLKLNVVLKITKKFST
jgi:hypothetical protein